VALSLVGTTLTTGATGSFPAGIQDGDLVLAYAAQGSSTTVPTLASGYQDVGSRSGNTTAMRTAYRFYQTGDASPQFSGSDAVMIEVYRGADTNDPIGAYNNNNASSSTITFLALTPFDKTDGTSWFSAAVVGNRPDVVIPAPTGTTLRQQSGTRPGWLLVDTNGGVTTWTQKTVTVSRAAGYTLCQVEVKAKTTVTVTALRRLPYKMSGMVQVQRDLPYKVRLFVQAQRDLVYKITKTVSAYRRLPSAIRTDVGISRNLLYGILEPVTTSTVGVVRSLPYGVWTLVGATRRLPYVVRLTVGAVRRTPYVVRTLAGVTRRIPYTTRVLVTALRRTPYAIRKFVSKAATLLWSVKVQTDSFTAADNTDITAHTSEDGFDWEKHPLYTPDAKIIGNSLHPVAVNNPSLHMATVIPATPDYDVVGNFVALTLAERSLPALCGRIVPNADTYLFVRLDTATGAHKIQLFKQVNSGATSLGIFNTTFTLTTLPEVRLRMVGNQVSVLANGVTVIGPVTVNDAALQNAGRWGVRTGQVTNVFSNTGVHIDRIRFAGVSGLPVPIARALPYKVRQLVSVQRRLPAGIRKLLTIQRRLPWIVRGLAGIERRIPSAIRAKVGISRILLSRIVTLVNEKLLKLFVEVDASETQVEVFTDPDQVVVEFPENFVEIDPSVAQVSVEEPDRPVVVTADAHPQVRIGQEPGYAVRVGTENPVVRIKEN